MLQNDGSFLAGIFGNLAKRRAKRFAIMRAPVFSSPSRLSASLLTAGMQRTNATPPPGRIPSSTAAAVACWASSTRSFFSFISTSVAAPTRITPTPPDKLCQALLELFAVVVRFCFFDLTFDQSDALFDFFFFACAFNKSGVIFADDSFFHFSKHVDCGVFQLYAKLFADHLAAGDDCNVFEHCFAAVAKARSFDGADFQAGAEAVDNECRKASPSTSSAMISSGRPVSATACRMGIISLTAEIFLSWMRT